MFADVPVIGVTGGPCGGKSTFLAEARSLLAKHGIYAVIAGEVATELITAGISPGVLGMHEFQDYLLRFAISRENAYREMADAIAKKTGKRVVVLADRGLPDCEPYIGEKAFRLLLPTMGLTRAALLQRYAMVVHLVSAAQGAEEHYTLANNTARSETIEQARELDGRTLHAWRGHPHLRVIDNSTDFNGKIHRALCALARILHMPDPMEIERRFKILNFDRSLIPHDAAEIDIVQTYLISPPHYERRVRAETLEGVTTYSYTEKVPQDDPIERPERKQTISKSDYEKYLIGETDARFEPVRKLRFRFPSGSQIFEVDKYLSGRPARMGLHILEVELNHRDDPITIPDGWDVVEITADLSFRNRELARIAA